MGAYRQFDKPKLEIVLDVLDEVAASQRKFSRGAVLSELMEKHKEFIPKDYNIISVICKLGVSDGQFNEVELLVPKHKYTYHGTCGSKVKFLTKTKRYDRERLSVLYTRVKNVDGRPQEVELIADDEAILQLLKALNFIRFLGRNKLCQM